MSESYVAQVQNQESYGYKPFKLPLKEGQKAQVEQDIDPINAANDVIAKLNAINDNNQKPQQKKGELVHMGDA